MRRVCAIRTRKVESLQSDKERNGEQPTPRLTCCLTSMMVLVLQHQSAVAKPLSL